MNYGLSPPVTTEEKQGLKNGKLDTPTQPSSLHNFYPQTIGHDTTNQAKAGPLVTNGIMHTAD
jgi:hypothetical protein